MLSMVFSLDSTSLHIIFVLLRVLEADAGLHAECCIYHHGSGLGRPGLLSWGECN